VLTLSSHSSSLLKSPTSTVGDTVGAHVAPPQAQAAPVAQPVQAAQPAEDAPAVKAFDDWIADHLQPYLIQSEQLGGVVADQVSSDRPPCLDPFPRSGSS
jgi:hypothetical protein